jgi:hypothetical protein
MLRQADTVVFDGNSPNMIGWEDSVAAIILHTNVGDIEHVIVEGQFRKKDRKLVRDTGTYALFEREGLEVSFTVAGEIEYPRRQVRGASNGLAKR